MPNFIKSKKLFVDGRTYVPTHVRTDERAFETGFIFYLVNSVKEST